MVQASGGGDSPHAPPTVLLAASLLNFAACLMKRRVLLGSAVMACDAAVAQLAAVEELCCPAGDTAHGQGSGRAGDDTATSPVHASAAAGEGLLSATADRFQLREHEEDGVNTAADAVFRLKIKCMFRKGQCLIDTGEYGQGMAALMAAQGELQDAMASARGGEGGRLQLLLRSVQRALQRGKYIAQHSKRMVMQ